MNTNYAICKMNEEYTIERGYLPYIPKLANAITDKDSQKIYLQYKNKHEKEKYLRELTANGFLKRLDPDKLETKQKLLKIIKESRFASNNKNAESFLESILGIDFIYNDYVTGWDFFESNGTRNIDSFRIRLMNTGDDREYYSVQMSHRSFNLD